jgi:hypothetical protein
MRQLSIGLIFFGVILMFSAVLMDTTRGGYYNIGLLADRQSLIMLGGFVFLGGAMLLGISILKNKGQNSSISAAESFPNPENRNVLIENNSLPIFIWWNSQSLGERTMLASSLLVLLSIFFNWTYVQTNIGTSGNNTVYKVYYEHVGQGMGYIGFFLYCFWGYPLFKLWQRKKIQFLAGMVCVAPALILAIWHLVETLTDARNTEKFRDLTGGDYISTGLGIWLFIIGCIGYISGLIANQQERINS